MTNVGYATMSVIPSAKGFGAALTKGVAPEMAAAGKTSGLAFSKGLIAGVAGIAVGVVGVVGVLGAIGKTFHDMESTIRVTTGKSGKALDGLVVSAKNVGRGTAASLEDVGKTVAGLNQRLGLTGPVLETLSKQFLTAGRITKQSLDMNTVTGSFSAFNIKGKDTTKALDDLFRVSQATGVGINELAAATAKGAPAFRQFGMSFSDSAALVGVLDKAGINSGKTIGALTIGLTKFAKAGKDPQKALRDTVGEIKTFTKTGKDATAIKLAASIFGTKGAAQFVAAVKSGKVNLDDMMKSSGAGKDTILAAGSAVSTFSGKWAKFKNNVLIAVEPLATRVFKAFGDGMQFMLDVGLPAVENLGAAFASNVMPTLVTFGNFLTGTVTPGLQALVEAFKAGGTDITSSGFAGGMERIGLAARTVFDWITGTGIPALKNFATAVAIPALTALGTYIVATLIPNLVSFGFWINDNKGKVAVIAGVITAVLIPVLINMGVQHTISAAKSVVAWATTKISAVTSAAAQVAASYRIIGGWVASAAAATVSGAETVVIWGMYKAEAIKGAAITVASHARMAAAWVASKVSAVAQAALTAAAWVAAAIATAAAWVASTVQTIAALARQAVAMLAQKGVMVAVAVGTGLWTAAQWLLNAALTANPIGLVIAVIALLAVGLYTAYKKSETFRNIVDGAFQAVSTAASFMWKSVLKPTFIFITNAFLAVAGAIVHGAANAFGWVPGIGTKLQAAAATFDTFRDSVNRSLSGVKDRTVSVGVSFNAGGYKTSVSPLTAAGRAARPAFGAMGGLVKGGIKGTDSVPYMLMPHEFIVRSDGSNLSDAMKHFGIQGMAKGGLVPRVGLPSANRINSATNSGFNTFARGVDFSGLLGSLGGGGGGASRWASTILQVLAMLGQSPSNLGAVLRLINKESGGNPRAINLSDSNARAGHPSGGLIQTILSTFNSFAGPFRGLGMFNPLANLFAGLNYAIRTYGSIAAVDPRRHAGGYALGTNNAAPGYAWVGEHGKELVRFGGGEQVTPNDKLGGSTLVKVFIGDREIKDIVRVEVDGHTQSMVDGLVYGGAG